MNRNTTMAASAGLDNLLKKPDCSCLGWAYSSLIKHWMVEHRVVMNGIASTWDKSVMVFPRAQFWEYAD